MSECSDPFLNPSVQGPGRVCSERAGAADAVLLAFWLLVALWGLGSYGLYEPHEGHFAGVAREMVHSGDYLVPHLNGSPYLNKPPLLYWAIALGNHLFGSGEFAARLPSALFGWLGVVLAWHWASRLWGRHAGRLAAGMLAVSAGWFLFSHQAMIDAAQATLVFASLYLFWNATRSPASRRAWAAFWLVMALSMLAKGPVSVLFQTLAAAGWVLLRRRWDVLRHAGLWWGLPLTIFPAALWALLVERQHPGFLLYLFNNETVGRMQDTRWPRDYDVSQVSIPGYLVVTAAWCAPWVLVLPQALGFAWREARAAPEGADPEERARRDAVLLLALGMLGPVLIFLPMPSRLVYYSLPALPPFAMLCAGWWQGGERGMAQAQRSPWRGAACLLLLAGLAACVGAWWLPGLAGSLPDMRQVPETLGGMANLALLGGGALAIGACFLFQERPRAAAAWICLLLGAAWLNSVSGFGHYDRVRSSKRLVAALAGPLGPDAVWVSEGSKELGASAALGFYLGEDARGHPRFVRVMVDDPRRPQPRFPGAERGYAMTRAQLFALWRSERPAVFVTDLMRRDWASAEQEPLYLEREDGAVERHLAKLGEPLPETWGFRKVFVNETARRRLAPSD